MRHNARSSLGRTIHFNKFLFDELTFVFFLRLVFKIGFTAWSSSRQPTQVFTLLETIYHSFDEIAKRRGVFKVETIGDCYVAVCGLPDPRKYHASKYLVLFKNIFFIYAEQSTDFINSFILR